MKLYKRVLLVSSIMIILLAAGLFYGFSITGQATKNPIKIGGAFGLSSSFSFYGKSAQNGVNLAVKEINENGGIGGRPVNIVSEDTESNPSKAVNAVRKMITTDGVPAIITFSGASSALATIPVANENEVLQLELICYAPGCHTEDDYVFRVSGLARYEPEFLANIIFSKGISNVSVFYVNNDLGASYDTIFAQKFHELGGNVLLREMFEQEEQDFRTLILKGIDKKSETFVVFSYDEIAYLLKNKYELGSDIPVYGMQATFSPTILNVGGEGAEGVFYSSPGFDLSNPNTKSFDEKYRKEYGQPSNIYAAKGYDAMKIFAYAIERCIDDLTGTCLKKQLEIMPRYDGASNTIIFDEHGDIGEEVYHLATVKNGEFVSLIE